MNKRLLEMTHAKLKALDLACKLSPPPPKRGDRILITRLFHALKSGERKARVLVATAPLPQLRDLLTSMSEGDVAASHPDASIFAAARLVQEADEKYELSAYSADAVVAVRESRRVTPEDLAATEAASQAYEDALDGLLAMTPHSIAGVRAILKVLAIDGRWERETAIFALHRLIHAPALAERG